jgi:hypothetical protein
MKKGILILVGMFMMVAAVEAKTGNKLPNRIGVNYAYNEAVNFVERGIEFFIFTNGDFDFNTHQNDSYYDYNGSRIKNNSHVRIDRDYRGRITRVENVFINYDYRGNVSRVGSIFIGYRRDRLTKVGDLRIRYDRYGYPVFYGNVRNYYYNNGVRFNISFGDVCDYNDAYFYRSDFNRNYNQFREDSNFYYYKATPNAKIGKRSTIIKRRKPATTIDRNKNIKRDSNNSYRKSTNDKRIEVVKDTRRSTSVIIDRNENNRRDSNNSFRKATNDKKDEVLKNNRRSSGLNIDKNENSRRNSINSNRKPSNDKKEDVRKETKRTEVLKIDSKNTTQKRGEKTRNIKADSNSKKEERKRRN